MRPPKLLILLLAVALLAASTSAVKWLQVHRPFGVEASAINFCNVLFVGNLAAGLVTLTVFGPRRIGRDLLRASLATHGLLAVNSLLAVAIPALLFSALERTSVTSVVLLGRFESVAFALLAALLTGRRPGRIEWAGNLVIVGGILVLVLTQTDGMLRRGELYVILAALLQGGAALLARRTLAGSGLGTFVFTRNLVSAVVFFSLGAAHFGLGHFADAFGPRLWAMMTVYALVIVVGGQLAWYRALRSLSPEVVATGSLAGPAFGLLFAYVLLGEVPTGIQWVGAGVVFTGMVLVRLGRRAPAGASGALVEKSLAGA